MPNCRLAAVAAEGRHPTELAANDLFYYACNNIKVSEADVVDLACGSVRMHSVLLDIL